ncbi:MAG: FKBP-type peptidyl-prolyl cis-trans isomerase [Salinibacterium sp.]|nr:FKBP-type peptidyl-prolyl cis-trans isomerase [Salinibacterium sp.]
MRIATSLIVTAGLLASLAACSASPGSGSADCATTPSGSASSAITVTGDFLKAPKVDFSIPLAAPKTTERSVIIKGDGAVVHQGDSVNVLFSIYSGANSADIAGTDWATGTTTKLPVDASQFLPGIVKTLECSTVGSRVVGVIPPSDGFGETGSTNLGVGATDAIVFVVDIESISPPAEPVLPKADGVDQPLVDGMPTVVLDNAGRPTVTIPDTAAPTELKLAVLKKGGGAVVAAGDNVTVNYEGLNWATKEIFDESWSRGTPANFNTAQVIAGFTQALVGQTVGSQVIVVIPPALGYGEASDANTNALAGQTLVFVIDILGIG